jgi:DNA-binding HxlR family transcriptional regulator
MAKYRFRPGSSGESEVDDPDVGFQDLGEDSEQLFAELRAAEFDFSKEIQEVKDINFKLDAHPEDDVVGFNELYAEVQAYQSRVTAILMDLHTEKARWMRYGQRSHRILRKLRGHILATMTADTLKALKNKEVIEATIQQQIPEWFDIQEYIDNVLENLDHLIDTVVLKRDDLGNANVNMSRQQKAVDTLVGLQYPVAARRSAEA